MEATKNRAGFKQSVKNTGRKAKAYVGKKAESAKNYGRKYKTDIREAYDVGYARGWDDAAEIPRRVGAKSAAAYGYRKGIKHRRRSNRYNNQYRRKGKQN